MDIQKMQDELDQAVDEYLDALEMLKQHELAIETVPPRPHQVESILQWVQYMESRDMVDSARDDREILLNHIPECYVWFRVTIDEHGERWGVGKDKGNTLYIEPWQDEMPCPW